MKLDRFRREEPEFPFPFAAMIDVLFLMIIFLVLGANFDTVQSLPLPRALGGQGESTAAKLVLRANGQVQLNGAQVSEADAQAQLQALAPTSVLLLPERTLDVDTLFRWHARLQKTLNVPIRVGVSPKP